MDGDERRRLGQAARNKSRPCVPRCSTDAAGAASVASQQHFGQPLCGDVGVSPLRPRCDHDTRVLVACLVQEVEGIVRECYGSTLRDNSAAQGISITLTDPSRDVGSPGGGAPRAEGSLYSPGRSQEAKSAYRM